MTALGLAKYERKKGHQRWNGCRGRKRKKAQCGKKNAAVSVISWKWYFDLLSVVVEMGEIKPERLRESVMGQKVNQRGHIYILIHRVELKINKTVRVWRKTMLKDTRKSIGYHTWMSISLPGSAPQY